MLNSVFAILEYTCQSGKSVLIILSIFKSLSWLIIFRTDLTNDLTSSR